MSLSFFGLQVAVKNFQDNPLRRALHDLIREDKSERVGVQAKQRFWRRFSDHLADEAPLFEFGDWDLVRGSGAKGIFDEWSSSIEAGAAGDDEAQRASARPSYTLVTMMVLVDWGSNADKTLGEWCDLPEHDWLTRQTFGDLVAVFPRLNFANVQADAVYVIPGHDGEGLSDEDLRSPDHNHLKPLT